MTKTLGEYLDKGKDLSEKFFADPGMGNDPDRVLYEITGQGIGKKGQYSIDFNFYDPVNEDGSEEGYLIDKNDLMWDYVECDRDVTGLMRGTDLDLEDLEQKDSYYDLW